MWRKEPACDACRAEVARLGRERYAAMPPEKRAARQARSAARKAAMTRIGREYRTRFDELLLQVRAELAAENPAAHVVRYQTLLRLAEQNPRRFGQLLAEELTARGLTP